MILDLLLAIGWIIFVGIIWALLIFSTSLAWHSGELFVGLQMFKWYIQNKGRLGIENPHEVKDETTRNKKRKR